MHKNSQKKSSDNFKTSIPVGIFLLAMGLLAIAFIWQMKTQKRAVETMGDYTYGERNLPIYCVQTDEKKVALSFDAAWGAYNLRKKVTL